MKNSKVVRRELAYAYLREQILNCILKPGEVLFEEKIAGQLGISKTPIRQAIYQLEKEGLVCVYPRKGITVSEISLSLVHELFETRLLIEPHIACSACGKIETVVLNSYREQFEQLDIEHQDVSDIKALKIDWDFHNAIIETSQNRFLIETMQNINAHYHRLRVLAAQADSKANERFTVEHLNIIDEMIAGNRDRVESLFRKHVQSSYEEALRLRF